MNGENTTQTPSPKPETSQRAFIVWLSIVFVLSRFVFFLAGVRLNDTPLGVFMQYLDPELLKTRLLESVFYLHIQPPFFNLFLGAVLKLLPDHAAFAFGILYSLMAWALAVATFTLQTRLGVSRILAFALTVIFMFSPGFVSFEHHLFYTMPCAALLAWSALFFHKAVSTGSRGGTMAYFACLVLLCGIRTSYHLFYFLAASLVLVAICPGQRKRILAIGSVAMVIVFAFYAKNCVLLGRFTVCTWTGKHLWIKTAGNLPWETRKALVDEGKLSEVSLFNRFTALARYPEEYRTAHGFEGIPALWEEAKSSREINYNHLGQIAVSEQYGRDGWYVLLHYPKTYLLTTLQALFNYFEPTTSSRAPSRQAAEQAPAALKSIYGTLFLDKLLIFNVDRFPCLSHVTGKQIHIVYLLALPALFFFGCSSALRRGKTGPPIPYPDRVLIGYLCFHIGYVAAIGSMMEILETHRFRFETDAFSIVLLGLAIEYGKRRFPRKTAAK